MSLPKESIKGFVEAVIETLRRRPLFKDVDPILEGYGPLQGMVPLGDGGNGFVVRGFVVETEAQGSRRIRWFVVKGPLPFSQGADASRLVLENFVVEVDYDQRAALGQVPGLGPVPTKVDWPVELVRLRLPRTVQVESALPTITLVVFEIPDERVADEPPWNLAHFVQGPVERAVDLRNWCEIARSLGWALLAMHAKGWAHRDIKLANVIAQQSGRFLRSIELIDFGALIQYSRYARPGEPVDTGDTGTKQYWRPARVAAWQAWEADRKNGADAGASFQAPAASAVDEDVYAYASLLGRVLLGRCGAGHPDRPWAHEVERLVADLCAAPSEPVDPVAGAITRAFGLVHDLLTREHAGSFEPINELLHQVELLRIEAEDGDSPSTARSPLARLPWLLEAGDPSGADERLGCERYVVSEGDLALRACGFPPGEPPSIDVAVELLRNGYVCAARAVLDDLVQDDARLDELLRRPRALEHDGEAARTLRVYVGQILLREGDEARGRAILARYRERVGPEAPPTGLAWWIRMLTARFDFARRNDVPPEALAEDPLDDRQRLWLVAFEAQRALRRREPVPGTLLDRLERVSRAPSVSMSERLFVDMLLARCLARGGDPVGALQCLHKAAAEASRLRFPVEYASVLYHVPEVLLDFGDRERLEQDRLDVGALLKTGEDLALRGADLLHLMKVGAGRDHAIHVAGRCAAARGGRAGVAAAACWHELADANAILSGRPSSVRRADLLTLRDPPAVAAQPRYDRTVLEKVWGTGGLCVDLPGGEGAALDALLHDHAFGPDQSPVLVIGCGAGGDVFHLAAKYPGLQVHGVDAYALNLSAARGRASRTPLPRGCSVRLADVLQGQPLCGEDTGGEGPWRLVIMRETLADVTLKRSFLHALRARVQQGTRLLISSLVQNAAEGPSAWQSQLQRLGVPNLTTRHALLDDLQAASFAVEREALDGTRALLHFLERRQRWFEHSEDEVAEALHGTAEHRWVKRLFEKLVDAAESGALGWLRLGAIAVAGDPHPPGASNKKWSLSPPT